MGEQTILCGVLQTGSILCFNKLLDFGFDSNFSSKLVQFGWETITEELKHNGITGIMSRLDDKSRFYAHKLSNELKEIMKPLFQKHMDDILEGKFSHDMMLDWSNDDKNLLMWREQTAETNFEKASSDGIEISNQDYFDKGILMIAFVKSGVELAYETMVNSGIIEESAYYESLHELPLIANLVARKKLYEMNRIISDTAEYGCYLFNHKCIPLLEDFMETVKSDFIGSSISDEFSYDQTMLDEFDRLTHEHSIEIVGKTLRSNMDNMKKLK